MNQLLILVYANKLYPRIGGGERDTTKGPYSFGKLFIFDFIEKETKVDRIIRFGEELGNFVSNFLYSEGSDPLYFYGTKQLFNLGCKELIEDNYTKINKGEFKRMIEEEGSDIPYEDWTPEDISDFELTNQIVNGEYIGSVKLSMSDLNSYLGPYNNLLGYKITRKNINEVPECTYKYFNVSKDELCNYAYEIEYNY